MHTLFICLFVCVMCILYIMFCVKYFMMLVNNNADYPSLSEGTIKLTNYQKL